MASALFSSTPNQAIQISNQELNNCHKGGSLVQLPFNLDSFQEEKLEQ